MEHQSRKAAVPDLTEHPHYLKQIYKLLPPCNLIYADKDLVVRYMNQASRNTLAKIEHLLPCKVDEMIGKSIDIFHQTTGPGAAGLASEKNLPHHAYIQLGTGEDRQTIHPVYDERRAGRICDGLGHRHRAIPAGTGDAGHFQFAALRRVRHRGQCRARQRPFPADDGLHDRRSPGQEPQNLRARCRSRSAGKRDALGEIQDHVAQSGEFRRLAKGNREMWVACTYYPIPDIDGKSIGHAVYDRHHRTPNCAITTMRQIAAIGKSQAVIESPMEERSSPQRQFPQGAGYTLDEIKGKHPACFDEPTARGGLQRVWRSLNRGEYVPTNSSASARAAGKSDSASYNPILGLVRQTLQVVKYAPTSPNRSCATPTMPARSGRQQGAGGDRVQDGWNHYRGQRQFLSALATARRGQRQTPQHFGR